MSKKPRFVLISDVHYSLQNLELSDRAFRAAIDKAAELGVPLIDCGDITNDKAILRGEVMNRMIETFKYANSKNVRPYLLVGNHSLLNEKSIEHALNFLSNYALIIDSPMYLGYLEVNFIPYQTDPNAFLSKINEMDPRYLTICHQGVKEADKGDYVYDKSAIDSKLLRDYRIWSGHYHHHQTVDTVTYVGNPFTMSFGEANDGPKGFLVVYDDGSFEQVVLPFRKHVVLEVTADDYDALPPNLGKDLVWVKVTGIQEELDRLKPHGDFKLEKTVINSPQLQLKTQNLTSAEILDALIDNEPDSDENKTALKQLWREVVE